MKGPRTLIGLFQTFKEIGEWLVPRSEAATSQGTVKVRSATHAGC